MTNQMFFYLKAMQLQDAIEHMNRIKSSVNEKAEECNLSNIEIAKIVQEIDGGVSGKIQAIKFYRNMSFSPKIGLKEAKERIDFIIWIDKAQNSL